MRLNVAQNTKRNIWYGGLNKIILLLLPFLVRTTIIYVMGADYLGLDSLFTSILQVLNLTELGMSSAIVYSMYAPIANNDTNGICALLALYKKVYRFIGMIILLVGLCIIPFLNGLIKGDYPVGLNIYILYLIY